MRISVKSITGLVASVALLIGTVGDVSAQGKKKERRALIEIEVTASNDKCLYEIKDARDSTLTSQQDTFFVEAGAVLNVIANGTAARFRIADDAKKKVKGFKKKGTANVEAGEEDYLRVRDERKTDPGSWHKVWIHCCESFNADRACVNPVEANSFSSAGHEPDRINRASVLPFEEFIAWLLGADEPDSGPPLPGGPGMDVEP